MQKSSYTFMVVCSALVVDAPSDIWLTAPGPELPTSPCGWLFHRIDEFAPLNTSVHNFTFPSPNGQITLSVVNRIT
jgi:hypothetical protein